MTIEEEKILCLNCYEEVGESDGFCKKCGVKFGDELVDDAQIARKETRKNPKGFTGFVAALISLAVNILKSIAVLTSY